MVKKLWGGRFKKKTDPLAEEFTKSIQYDYKLAKYDLLGSIAHVQVLKKAGYLKAQEAIKLIAGLNAIYKNVDKKSFSIKNKEEDIHTYIQNELQKKAGDLVLRLHTARSRNDQVAVAMKLYCKDSLGIAEKCVSILISALNSLAFQNKDLVIPGFTHMQHAQPVYLKDYLGAYIQMLKRDYARLNHISHAIKITMGAGALAGTPIDAKYYIQELSLQGGILKFKIEPAVNSLDSVSDRDFVIEIISALSIIATHLSRMAEDLIVWSTKEFDFIEIDEAFCTGSSLMPQKKNADVLELIRGYAGRINGNLISVLTMMKGLPLTYNRDMQLDKEPLFNSFEITANELKVLARLVKTLKFKEEKIKEHLKDESLYATDIVYYLVNRKVPFQKAHTVVGRLIKHSIDNEIEIKEIPEIMLKKFSDKFVKKEIVKLFDAEVSVKSKRSVKRSK